MWNVLASLKIESTKLSWVRCFGVLSSLIYPNPATHSVNVKSQRVSRKALEILNELDKICLAGSSQLEEFEIDLSGINAGTYFVRIWYDDHTSTKRLVKD